jgi:hypothetical protein
MLDFPNSPTVGQTFAGPTGTFKWDGVKWAPSAGIRRISIQRQLHSLGGPITLCESNK